MRIKEKLSQNRRDFWAIFVCPHCTHEEALKGYDDEYFHRKVIPKIKCGSCGKIEDSEYKPMSTVYPEGYQI
jgi:transcription elongation factor Elf1